MKVILSRKGFDLKYGGCPSPILTNKRMISLPIPADEGKFEKESKYSNLKVEEKLTYYELMKPLIEIKNKKLGELTENTLSHFDPDINPSAMERKPGWKPLFGQIGAAQKHLDNQRVGVGDLFLFFGTFRETIKKDGEYQFDSSTELFHAIYGYLQIGEIKPINNKTEIPEWMDYHPHAHQKRPEDKYNTIYVARDRLTWQPDMPGAGLLSFTKKLILTKKGCPKKSIWYLPKFFEGVEISYNKKSWKDGYFHSADMGQEFVIKGKYLFSWDEIPGNDDVRLIEFLNQNFGIDWVKTAKLEKIDNDKTIKVSTEKNYLSLRLNDEKTNVNLKIDDIRTDEFIVKVENGKLNIYQDNKKIEIEDWVKDKLKKD
ncbi:MAG: hypothetical protein O8C61_00645 [Candidatus Methanoperedens sp.]|nr:hypothetical protein [Candidatus Methanoperedens sp.]